jgi:hypothetical protein
LGTALITVVAGGTIPEGFVGKIDVTVHNTLNDSPHVKFGQIPVNRTSPGTGAALVAIIEVVCAVVAF